MPMTQRDRLRLCFRLPIIRSQLADAGWSRRHSDYLFAGRAAVSRAITHQALRRRPRPLVQDLVEVARRRPPGIDSRPSRRVRDVTELPDPVRRDLRGADEGEPRAPGQERVAGAAGRGPRLHGRELVQARQRRHRRAAEVQHLDRVVLPALVRPVAADPEHEFPAAAVPVPEHVAGAVRCLGPLRSRDRPRARRRR
jgi:hypothetical protein